MPANVSLMGTVIGGAAGASAAGIGGHIVHTFAAGTGVNAALKQFDYIGNAKFPHSFPGISETIASNLRGYIDGQTAHDCLLTFGVNLYGTPGDPIQVAAQKVWKAVEQMHLPRPTLEYAYAAYARGIITKEQRDEIRKHHADRYGTMPGFEAYAKNPVDFTNLTLGWFRGTLDDFYIDGQIKRATGWDDDDIEAVRKNMYTIPGVQDQIRFVVREAYNPQQVIDLKLDEEYEENEQFSYWVEKSGLKEIPANTFPGQIDAVDWGRMYWRAHWSLPSPTQAYEMLHRLRPGAEQRYQQGDFRPEPVNFDTVRSLLKANDYSPAWRDRLAAISYSPITRVDIRRLYFDGAIDEKEVYECYLDIGYNERNAESITKWLKNQKKSKEDKDMDKPVAAKRKALGDTVVKSYRVGAIDRKTAFVGLVNLKVDADAANLMLDNADYSNRLDTAITYIESIRKEYFLGLYDREQVIENLLSAGISPAATSRYADKWTRQLRVPRRVAAANTVLSWFREGLIQEDEVLLRLHNLGYGNTDQLLYLQSAYRDIEKEKLRRLAATARDEKDRAKAAEQALRQAAADHRLARKEIERLYGEDDIKRWYKAGLFDERMVRDALAAIDFEEKAIALRLAEWAGSNPSGN